MGLEFLVVRMVQQGYGSRSRIRPAADKKGAAARSSEEGGAGFEQATSQGQVEVGVVDWDMHMLPSLVHFDNAGEAPIGRATVRPLVAAEVKPGGEAGGQLLNVGFGQRACCETEEWGRDEKG